METLPTHEAAECSNSKRLSPLVKESRVNSEVLGDVRTKAWGLAGHQPDVEGSLPASANGLSDFGWLFQRRGDLGHANGIKYRSQDSRGDKLVERHLRLPTHSCAAGPRGRVERKDEGISTRCHSPSLHLQHFLVGGQIMSRADLCNLVGLDHARPFISYTAASPTAVENEEKIVAALMNAVDTGALPQQLQVLLRLNPMEDGQRFGQLRAKYRNLIIQKPSWVWDSKLDWCCALKQDTDIWCATVNHAAMNVSVPSTATLEFAALGRHVVNVCFDLDPSVAPERSARRFWLADFYADIREAQIATPAFTFDELQAKIAQRLSGNGETARIASRRETGNPVRHILESVHSFFH